MTASSRTDQRQIDRGDQIVIGGERISIGVPVVLWTDPGGHDAYEGASQRACFEAGRPASTRDSGIAAEPARVRDSHGVRRAVDQFVLHYDACGVSRECFRALNARGLSVHFMLDIDGTLYQTLDLAETAWHARQANGRSIGVEIASIGAWAPGSSQLDTWYTEDRSGTRITLPASLSGGGVRTKNFTARPARSRRRSGMVNGRLVEQYDFTPEQYESLAHLTAALVREFPELELRFPTDGSGRVRADVLAPAEFERFKGILGHQHVTAAKTDPGPAFNWKWLESRTRSLLLQP